MDALFSASSSKTDIVEYKPNCQLKADLLTSQDATPGGNYGGSFTADYEYVSGIGNLDQFSGILIQTAQLPNETYLYFLSKEFPTATKSLQIVVLTSEKQENHTPGQSNGLEVAESLVVESIGSVCMTSL
jgi:hypothetical protein